MIHPRLGFRDVVEELTSETSERQTDLSGCSRQIEGRLRPQNVRDVVRVVKAARKHGVKLYPYSCGRNWGFGSGLPTCDGAWQIDLSKMTRIVEIDSTAGVVTLEPGVTQGALFQALTRDGDKWFFNLTGAGQSISVLGNALERGIGYYGQRQNDLLEVQVVTGRGEVLWTRLGRDEAGTSGASIGTDLTHLFCHANFGIIVAARIRLLRRTDGGGVVIARLKEGKPSTELFERVLTLKQEGCISGVPHIGNRERIVSTMVPWLPDEQAGSFASKAPTWTAALPLAGRLQLVKTAADIIRDSLGNLCYLEVIIGNGHLDLKKANPSPLEQLQHLACGFPSNLALPGVQWSALGSADLTIDDPETTAAGLIHVTPAIRSCTAEIARTLELIRQKADSLGLPSLATTVNIVDSLTTVLVLSIPFHQRDSVVVQGRARALHNELARAGIGFYRMGLIHGSNLRAANTSACRLHAKLKKVFDPFGVFAPSKYDSLFSASSTPAVKSTQRIRSASILTAV